VCNIYNRSKQMTHFNNSDLVKFLFFFFLICTLKFLVFFTFFILCLCIRLFLLDTTKSSFTFSLFILTYFTFRVRTCSCNTYVYPNRFTIALFFLFISLHLPLILNCCRFFPEQKKHKYFVTITTLF
jgi:hypothetical protein